MRIPAWGYEQYCVQKLFPQFVVSPAKCNSSYFYDYTLQHKDNTALQLSIECKTDMKARSTGRVFVESVDASLNSDGTLRGFHVSNILSFRYDYLVILCPSQQEPPCSVLAFVFSVRNVPSLIRSAIREWEGKPSSHPRIHTHTRGWLVELDKALHVADFVSELSIEKELSDEWTSGRS